MRLFYEQLMKALPDLEIEIQHQYAAEDAVLVEVIIRGTHLGGWRGLPGTGRRIEFPLCGLYTLTPMISWPAKKSTMTVGRSSDNSVYFTSPEA